MERCITLEVQKKFIIGTMEVVIVILTSVKKHYSARELENFFLYGSGGASSKYSRSCGLNSWEGSEEIIPYTEEKARKWMEKYADVEDYIKVFGEPEE